MVLPFADQVWPPEVHHPVYSKMAEWAAWYSGEPSRIIDVYSGGLSSQGNIPWWRFWSRARQNSDGAQRAQLHVPLASDLAGVSGALLFGEAPKVRIRAAREGVPAGSSVADPAALQQAIDLHAAHIGGTEPTSPESQDRLMALMEQAAEGADRKKPTTAEERAEVRLLKIVEEGDLYSRLVEAAESAAAMGGVYIYPVWDRDLRDFPLMAVAQADMAAPEFRWGLLTAVTFWRIVGSNAHTVYRHLERHEVEGTGESRKAVVLHGLYRGSVTHLGAPVPLAEIDATARLAPRVELPFQELDVEYVPNIRPNRLWRSSGLGVADIQGSETLLDALDETYASWMRDVRLAKARILVPREYLRQDPDSGRPAFDIDQEIYVPMDMEPGLSQDARAMLAHQFGIRWKEHKETAADLVERIVSNAGYTPTTLSGATTGRDTGTALRIGEHRTLLTLRRKSTWWRTAIANVLHRMMIIDAEVFESGIEPVRPVVITADSIIDNPLELAQTALAMKTAESASVETRVRLLHPDWSSAEVAQEVERIKSDMAAAPASAPAVGGGSGKFGDSMDDPASTAKKPTTMPAMGPAPKNAPPMQVTKKQ